MLRTGLVLAMMTDSEREYLEQKRDGIIPQSMGWAEWKLSQRVPCERCGTRDQHKHWKPYCSSVCADAALWRAQLNDRR